MDERTDRQIQSLFSIQTAHFKKRGYNNLTEMSFNRTRLYKKTADNHTNKFINIEIRSTIKLGVFQ